MAVGSGVNSEKISMISRGLLLGVADGLPEITVEGSIDGSRFESPENMSSDLTGFSGITSSSSTGGLVLRNPKLIGSLLSLPFKFSTPGFGGGGFGCGTEFSCIPSNRFGG